MGEDNLIIYNKYKAVPSEAKKTIPGGRLRGMTDINPMWRIKSLTEQFGAVGKGWYYDILEERIEEGANGERVAFVKINLFVKYDDEWSKPIVGLGGSSFIAKEKSGLYTSDECFKMALTDAIGIACKALGIGADVWWESDKSKYENQAPSPSQKTQTQKQDKPSGTWTPGSIAINFGKHKGKTLGEILLEDESYVKWLSEKAKDEVIRKASTELLLGNAPKEAEQIKITDNGLPEGFEGLEPPEEDVLPF